MSYIEPYTMYRDFIATAKERRGPRSNGVTVEVQYKFRAWIDNNGVHCSDYGFEHKIERDLHEGWDSCLSGQTYDLHHVVLPKEGDIVFHPGTGRTFMVGKVEGFVNYSAPLLENGAQVSTIFFEDYYKD